MMFAPRSSVSARIAGAADQALHAAGSAIEQGRDFASKAADKVGSSARDLRDGAAAAATQGAESVGDTATAARRQLKRYARAGQRYAAEQPVKTALIAAAVGAGVTALIVAIACARRRED